MFRLIRHIIGILFIFAVGYLFGIKGVRFYEVTSGSMEPTVYKGDRLVGVNITKPALGDIVVLKDPEDKTGTIVKRIIGLPGDRISVTGGYVYVNDIKLHEPYVKELPVYELNSTVSAGKVFVLGDNRNDSTDSSIWGSKPLTDLRSRIVLRYWPFSKVSILTRKPRLGFSL